MPQVAQKVSVAAVLAVAAVLTSTPAVARTPAMHSSDARVRQHLVGGSARVEAAPARAAATAIATASAAGAQLEPCDEAAPDGLCGTVDVPLERAHPSRGTVSLFFEYFPQRNPGQATEAILVTEGGPGFSVTQDGFIGPFYRELFDPLLDSRGLVLLDQRGVGRSGAIDCAQVQHGSDDIYRDVQACGEQLGSAAYAYGSGDVALDAEAVRKALGIEKLDLYGGSYAAQDVQSYATRFPGRVRSAILDSPFTTFGYDTFGATTTQAIKRTVRLICARSESCADERKDAARSLAWLARRLRHRPVQGVGLDASGEPHQLRVTESFLLWRPLQTEDGGYVAVSEIPAAADALRAGDKAPLLRLAAESDGELFFDEGEPPVFSAGDNWARFCADASFPWDKDASPAKRLRQWQAARAELRRRSFAPFSIDGWLAPFPIGAIAPEACLTWPAQTERVAPPIPRGAKFPAGVPALILSADLDFVTTSADARRVAGAWSNSRFVEVANSGHHTATHIRSRCVDPIIVSFIAELDPGDTSCASTAAAVWPSVGRFALTAADARPAKSAEGDLSTKTDRRVATVATAAVTDALRRTFLLGEPGSGIGLRGGTFSHGVNEEGTAATNELNGVRFARDVAVSGSSAYDFETEVIDATITIDGPGAEDGTLHVSGVWFPFFHEATVFEVTGELGGRSVTLRTPAS